MIVIGVTGSIGTGKSYISSCFKRLGYPVFDADGFVHHLMQHNPYVITAIAKEFPEALHKDVISREKLRPLVKNNKKALSILEKILHPVVRKAELRFLSMHQKLRQKIGVLDIPLLFETGADALCDMVLVTHVNEKIQQQRVLKRGEMSKEFLDYIKQLQLQQGAKLEQADIAIDTGHSKAYNFRKIQQIVNQLIH